MEETAKNRTKRYTRYVETPLKHEYIPRETAEKLISKKAKIVVWSEDEKSVLHTLCQEAGMNSGKLKFISIREYLRQHDIPDNSLASTAKDLRLGECPRDGVTSRDKVFKRFDTLRKVFKKIILIDSLDLIDGILI